MWIKATCDGKSRVPPHILGQQHAAPSTNDAAAAPAADDTASNGEQGVSLPSVNGSQSTDRKASSHMEHFTRLVLVAGTCKTPPFLLAPNIQVSCNRHIYHVFDTVFPRLFILSRWKRLFCLKQEFSRDKFNSKNNWLDPADSSNDGRTTIRVKAPPGGFSTGLW